METSRCDENMCLRLLFKSYYVVWKPEQEKIDVVNEIGLNRTM